MKKSYSTFCSCVSNINIYNFFFTICYLLSCMDLLLLLLLYGVVLTCNLRRGSPGGRVSGEWEEEGQRGGGRGQQGGSRRVLAPVREGGIYICNPQAIEYAWKNISI